MIYDDNGKIIRFGQIGYDDFLIYKHLEKKGKEKKGKAIKTRINYWKRHTKIKGKWQGNRYSKNYLSLMINW
jgi:hypothetical protein